MAIPLSAIVLGIGANVTLHMVRSRERLMEIRLKTLQEQNKRAGKANGGVLEQLEALRAEVAALRDTSTQFDMTTEHAMQRMEERLSRVETKVAVIPGRSDDQRQTVGHR